jgi:hypothetical protein
MPLHEDEYVVFPGGCRIIVDDSSTSNIHGTGLDANGLVTRIEDITGVAEECSGVRVSVVGVDADPVEADADPNTREWAAPPIIFNAPADLCGTTVTIRAECLDDPECFTEKKIFHFPCSDCPAVSGSVEPDGPCAGDERQVTFTLHFDPPLPVSSSAKIGWFYAPGIGNETVDVQNNELATHTHQRAYPAGSFFPGASVTVTLDGEDCDPVGVEFGAVTVQAGCSENAPCPEIAIDPVQVQGCVPESPFVVFTAGVTPPPGVAPAPQYHWTLTTPAGQNFTRTTNQPTADTSDLWVLSETGMAVEPVNLNTSGAYAISVSADLPNTQADCRPEDTRTFVVETCPECPVVVIGEPAVSGCVPGQATVSFSASVSPPGTAVSAYEWEVGFEGTGSATRTTTAPQASSEDEWAIAGGGSGSIRDHLTSVFVVRVRAVVEDLPEDCVQPTNDFQFVIPRCVENGDGNDDGDSIVIDWCTIWFWINVALMIGTGIFILITFCLIDASVWSAVLAIVSGGGLTAVWAALTAANITMLIISVVLALITCLSYLAWIIFCAFGNPGFNACQLLGWLITILSILNGLAFVLGLIFLAIGMVGCAVGSFVDVAWFGLLLSITWGVAQLLGCQLVRSPRR